MMKFKEIVFLMIVTASVSNVFSNVIPVHLNDVDADPEMEKYLREALENFREQMKEGIDAINMPRLDPLNLRNLDLIVNENFATLNLKIKEISFRGMSTFHVPNITADIETFFLKFKLSVPALRAKGKYDMDGKMLKIFPLNGNGTFSINITNVDIAGSSKLDPEEGTLQANKMDLDLSWNDLEIYLENFLGGGRFSNVMQRILPKVGKNIFDNFKPKILNSLNTSLKNALNRELRKPEVKKIIEGLIKP